MRLDRLLGDLEDLEVLEVRGDPSGTDVASVTHDSRQVVAGSLFCCLPGRRADGHRFATSAVERGARVLLCERFVDVGRADVAQLRVADARAAMAPVAAAFWGRPSRRLTVAGVTGTNGKTTTVHLLGAVLEADGRPTGLVGTLTGARTTPEATDLQARLAAFRAEGKEAVAMEVSSHALVQHRVDATWFAVAIFTNLGRDHLDFHGTTEAYFGAKALLFDPVRAAVGVVNADDPYGRRLLARGRLPVRPFSMEDAIDLHVGTSESTFGWQGAKVRVRLGGPFNVANALAAAAAAHELGVVPDVVAEGLSAAGPVPGRFEPVDVGQPFGVLVDYAHTPDALELVLSAARSSTSGRVLVVFGCGGERDRAKRPAMGEVAARLADVAVLTSDNPRGEGPMAIIDEVSSGVRRREVLVVEPDRRAAIALALTSAASGDVVVIAGKGHETGQEAGGAVEPFDDRQVAREVLEAR